MAGVLAKLSAGDLRTITERLAILESTFKDVMPWRSICQSDTERREPC
jgi:hypothetical protein